jgi:hypothetical protein
MPDEIKRFPDQEDETPPGQDYLRVQMVDDSGQALGVCWVRPDELKNAPVRHDATEPLLPMLRWVWRHLSGHVTWCRTFDEWKRGLARDEHPAAKAELWACHTYAYLDFTHRHPRADKAEVFRAVMSLMNDRNARVEPASFGRTLQTLLSNPPSVLKSVENFTTDGRLRTTEKHLR